MGSIYHINKNPEKWNAHYPGISLKPEHGGEPLLKIIYGTCDDDPGGIEELTMLMRKSVYEKIMNGEYSISTQSNRTLVVIDRNGNMIPPLNSDTIY